MLTSRTHTEVTLDIARCLIHWSVWYLVAFFFVY